MFDVPITTFIWVPANFISDAMIAFPLFTLGAQVAQLNFLSRLATVYYSLFLRLISGPLIALVILLLFRVEGIVAQALLIGSAMPTSVNSAVIAQEYDNEPELAAQIGLFSTLLDEINVYVFFVILSILFVV